MSLIYSIDGELVGDMQDIPSYMQSAFKDVMDKQRQLRLARFYGSMLAVAEPNQSGLKEALEHNALEQAQLKQDIQKGKALLLSYIVEI